MAQIGFRTKLGYGVGHVLNDLCSAVWFTYLLIYFHHVLLFNNNLAGVVLLIGQVADGISTPFVGYEADRTDDLPFCARYGRRKTWHLTGTICVLCAFPFIFLGCLGCGDSSEISQVIYYAPFVIIFQFGWAATQISHLSLIPTLTQDPHERTELNALRYGFTVMSNITVYLVTWLVMGVTSKGGTALGPEDAGKFRIIVFTVLGIGVLFSIIFHLSVKEENTVDYAILNACEEDGLDKEINNDEVCVPNDDVIPEVACATQQRSYMRISDWLKNVQFYQVATLYMFTRMFCNLTQAYVPIYLQDTLKLPEESVAYIPLVMYVAGFFTATMMKFLNKFIGRKGSYIIGAVIGGAGCIWIWFGGSEFYKHHYLYVVAAMLGSGASVMLVTSLSITADLIGSNVESGAFVYGAMSLTDKLSNGISVMVIQNLNPCLTSPFTNCCPKCGLYFQDVLFFWCGGAALGSIVIILTLLPSVIGRRSSDTQSPSEINEETPIVQAQRSCVSSQSYGSISVTGSSEDSRMPITEKNEVRARGTSHPVTTEDGESFA